MAARPWVRIGILFSALVFSASLAPAQATREIATLMPPDTLLYIGWADLYDKDHPDMRLARELARCVAAHPDLRGDGPVVKFAMDLAEIAYTVPAGVGLLDVTYANDEPRVSLVAVVAAGDRSEKLAATIDAAVRGIGESVAVGSVSIAGVAFKKIALGDSPLELLWGVHKSHVIVAIGAVGAEAVVKKLNGEAGSSLAANEEFKSGRAKTQASDSAGWMLNLYLDVKGALAKGRKVAADAGNPMPPDVDNLLKSLGVADVQSVYLHSNGSDLGPWTRCYVHAGEKKRGLLSLWKQKPLETDDWKIIPRDSYWASICNLDLSALWQETIDVIDSVEPDAVQQVEGGIAASRAFLGFSITDDLIPALGDTWAVFDAPSHGGLLITGIVLVADVLKPEAIDGILRRTAQIATPFVKENGVNLIVQKGTFDGYEVNYAVIGGVFSPFAPAWGLIEGRAVFGLAPQTVAAAMRQIDPKKRKDCILDHPGVKAAMARLPAKSVSWSYCDSELFTRLLHPIGLMYSTAISSYASAADAVVDLSVMASLAETLKTVRSNVGSCSVDDQGMLYSQYGTANALFVAAASGATASAVLLPSLSRARELAKRAVSASNLRAIGMACHMWADEKQGAFPASIAELVERGVLSTGQLVSPRDESIDEIMERNLALLGHGKPDWKTIKLETSYELIGGQSQKADLQNVLAYEKMIDGEGTNVLFLDGHVAWMKTEEFKRAIRATYNRLGRSGEVPTEFQE